MHLRPAGFHVYIDKFLPRPEVNDTLCHQDLGYVTASGQSSK
jgi:hypothetical protein